jgi:PIN domain nuclease of toxin-antitoxin system
VRVLLDTNVLLIWLGDSARITATLAEVIRAEENTIYYSPLSIWEFRIKAARGALQVDDNLLEEVKSKRFSELGFTSTHAEETKNLPHLHRDPFDRGLIAQARVEDLCLYTTNRLLARFDVRTRFA